MDAQNLSIQQLVFNATFPVKEETYALQNRISNLYSNKLHQLLQDFFEAHIPQEVIVKFDSLQLDLGTVNYNDLESVITDRLLDALKEHFPDHKINDNNTFTAHNEGEYTVQSLTTGLLQLLEIYLSTGSLPWWSANEDFATLQEKFRQLMAEEPIKVRALLIKIAQAHNVRKRIAWQLNEQTIHAIIHVLEPAEASFILEYHAGIVQLQKKEQIVKEETTAFEKDIWYFITTFLIKEYGSNFNRRTFVKSNLQTIANHYNIAYKSLLLLLNEATFAQFTTLAQTDFVKVIKEIFEDEKATFNKSELIKNNAEKANYLIEQLSIISYFLTNGSLPATHQNVDAAYLSTTLLKLMADNPNTIKKLIKELPLDVLLLRIWLLNDKKLQNEILKLLADEKLNELPAVLFFTDWNDAEIVRANIEIVKKLMLELPSETILYCLKFINNKEAQIEIAALLDIQRNNKLESNDFLVDLTISPLKHTTSDIAKLELIKFYFTFGAFPKTWPNINIANAGDFIKELADRKPYALKALLKYVKAEKIIKLLQPFINEIIFETLVRLLQPSLFNIIKKNKQTFAAILSKQNNSILNDNLTLIQNAVLEILLVQNNISYQSLLKEWINEILNKSIENNSNAITKFKTFSENIEKENFIDSEKNNSFLNIKEEITTEQFEQKSLINLLRYFISYGTYPWWADKFMGAYPSDLLNELYETNILQAIQVFKYAGANQQQMKRFLYQFAVALILKLIEQLPDGEIAVEAYHQILWVYETNILSEEAASVSKERLLLQMIWEQYISNNYGSFNVAFFYNDAAKKFFSWHGVLPSEIFIHADDVFKHYEKADIKKLFHAVRLLYISRQNMISAEPLPNEIFHEFITTLSSLKAGSNFSSYINQSIKKENNFSLNFDELFAQDKNDTVTIKPIIKDISAAFVSMLANMPEYQNKLLQHSAKVFVENKYTEYMEEVNEPFITGFINALSIGGTSIINNYTNNKTSPEIIRWILSLITEYFLQHGNLPAAFNEINNFSATSFIKSVLLNFHRTNTVLLQNLLEKYCFEPIVAQRLQALFNIQNANEKELLLLLNKIQRKSNKIIDKIETGPINKNEANVKSTTDSIDFSSLKQYYSIISDNQNLLKNNKHIINLLDYYLTWGILPASKTVVDKLPAINELIKESLLFLFLNSRSELVSLLQKNTHLFSAKIKSFSLFKPEAGGNDGLINSFLKDFVQEDIVSYFFSEGSEHIHTQMQIETGSILQHILPILLKGNFNYNKTELSEIDIMYKAAEVLEYFLLYNKLPDNLNNAASINATAFLKDIFRFLFYNNKDRLKSLLGKHTQHEESKMFLYELFFNTRQPNDVNITSFINEMVEKDLPAFLQYKIGIDLNGDNNNLLLLLEKIINRPEAKIKQILDIILAYSTGASFLAREFKGKNIFNLLEKANKSWADNTLFIINDLMALFNLNLKETSFLHSIILLLQEFSLLHFAGKINAADVYQLITYFFAFVDERMPVLTPGMYQHMQDFRRYINNNTTFSNTIIAMHFQKEIAQRLIHASTFNNFNAIENETTSMEIQNKNNSLALTNVEEVKQEAEFSELEISDNNDLIIHKQTIVDLSENNNTTNNIIKSTADLNKKIIASPDILRPSEPFNKEPIIEKPGTKIYVQNAGLVLLHPYLNTLFEFTDLLKERKFVSEAALFRAIHLSQYLIDGVAEHEEHLLALNKILCGASLANPLLKAIELTENEIDISSELFKIIFQRWDKMKNSSVEGFRQSFLQRQGMLVKNEDSWTLRVEQRGYDMLLQTIPWAFGTIKLPWMPEFLYVEWV